MTPESPGTHEISHTIGTLCVCGDWACAHGDLAGLHEVVRQLAEHVPEPIHCELVAVASACHANPDEAVARWYEVKTRVLTR